MMEKLETDGSVYAKAEDIVQKTDEERDDHRNKDNDERMCDGRPVRRPDDMSELFAHMLQVREW